MDLWFTEEESGVQRSSHKVKDVLFDDQSEFQKISIIDTESCGRMLVIDDCVMLTDSDEFVYHEMIAHVPVCMHAEPKRIVVIGGGDGGTVRELVKHSCIEEIILCEIDAMVVDQSRKWFPHVSSGLDDPRVKVRIGDGVAFMAEQESSVDIAIIDSTDPVGPGEGLFTREFYQSVSRALKPGGLMVAQSESPWYDEKILQRIYKNISGGFSHIRPYLGAVPTYPTGTWSWTLASKEPLALEKFNKQRLAAVSKGLKYLTADTAIGSFALPPFFQRKLNLD